MLVRDFSFFDFLFTYFFSAVLFAILKEPKYNIMASLTDAQYKDVRKNAISCILATDMAKHGEILGKFKAHADNFNFEDPQQRNLVSWFQFELFDIYFPPCSFAKC
jgi:high affinity cGMP-specific 3',5'-cyclic phosphodiesterase 9